jgi:hypothetical protein
MNKYKKKYLDVNWFIFGESPNTGPFAQGCCVPDAIIHPVISVSALALFIWHIYYLILQFLNNVIIIRTKVLFPQAMVTLVDFGRPV